MKNQILILLIISFVYCSAQNGTELEYDDFENQFLSYTPIQKPQVSKKDFDYASIIISETKSAVKHPKNFNLADYFNILSAFLTLKESEKNIKTAFRKFINANGSCEYVLSFENIIKNNSKYDLIRMDFLGELKKCKRTRVKKKSFNIKEYCKLKALDSGLVKKIYQVKVDDQKYRNESLTQMISKQKVLDENNQRIIDSLFVKYQTYIGESLVGEDLKSVMWAVIQHSNKDMMAKYLPIVQKAVKEKELGVGPFKMLIDRYYGLKYGYQIFGTQNGFGFKLADNKKREEIQLKYGIE